MKKILFLLLFISSGVMAQPFSTFDVGASGGEIETITSSLLEDVELSYPTDALPSVSGRYIFHTNSSAAGVAEFSGFFIQDGTTTTQNPTAFKIPVGKALMINRIKIHSTVAGSHQVSFGVSDTALTTSDATTPVGNRKDCVAVGFGKVFTLVANQYQYIDYPQCVMYPDQYPWQAHIVGSGGIQGVIYATLIDIN